MLRVVLSRLKCFWHSDLPSCAEDESGPKGCYLCTLNNSVTASSLYRPPSYSAAMIAISPLESHCVTPAMAAGVTSQLWEIGDIVDVLESWEGTDRKVA
jgi:hypothetical protein